MKEENNDTATTTLPTEAEMNEMHRNAWLNYHADAQQAKQDLSRRYAKMVNAFGSYKKMPESVKEILKEDYAEHKAKWSENGTEMQKRFGVKEEELAKPTEEQAEKRQEFLQNIKEQRQHQQSQKLEHEPS